jgi:PiT family inorganic phosphate transporter
LLFYLIRPRINKTHMHLLEQDVWVRHALVVVVLLELTRWGQQHRQRCRRLWPVFAFKDLSIGGLFVIDSVQQLYLLGALSIVAGIYTYSHKVMRTVGKDLFHLSPVTALIALMAEAFVLFLFASRGLYNFLLSMGLPTIPLVPVSSTQVIVGAVVGIGLVKGGKNIRYNILGRISLAWLAAPLIAFCISYCSPVIIQNSLNKRFRRRRAISSIVFPSPTSRINSSIPRSFPPSMAAASILNASSSAN